MEWLSATGIPIEAQCLYRKGIGIAASGQPERALVYLKQAVFLAPHYAKAIFETGNCLTRMGRYDEAGDYYRRAARIDPSFESHSCTQAPADPAKNDR
jgi:tetratricopeptide (TPR) repeat protein